jgi:hypothetical protein
MGFTKQPLGAEPKSVSLERSASPRQLRRAMDAVAPVSPADVLLPIKPPFMPPPAFESARPLERPRVTRTAGSTTTSSGNLSDGSIPSGLVYTCFHFENVASSYSSRRSGGQCCARRTAPRRRGPRRCNRRWSPVRRPWRPRLCGQAAAARARQR